MSALSNFCPKCRAVPGERCADVVVFIWVKRDTPHRERAANTPKKKSGWFS